MTNEQWERVKEAFDAALRRRPDERAQFLDEVCGADETMRREVEALLSSFDDAGGFMARPVVGEMAEAVEIRKTLLTRGQYLGHYLYVVVQTASLTGPRKTRVIPLPQGEMLPKLPPRGMGAADDPNLFPGSWLIDASSVSPSPDPSVYAYVKTTTHRNLFRIPLPTQ